LYARHEDRQHVLLRRAERRHEPDRHLRDHGRGRVVKRAAMLCAFMLAACGGAESEPRPDRVAVASDDPSLVHDCDNWTPGTTPYVYADGMPGAEPFAGRCGGMGDESDAGEPDWTVWCCAPLGDAGQ
jgi:hypothetical protein